MAKNTSITLGKHFDEYVNQQLESGRYGSVSEVIRAGLRLLEDSDVKMHVLRSLLEEGEKSGYAEYSYEKLIAELDREPR